MRRLLAIMLLAHLLAACSAGHRLLSAAEPAARPVMGEFLGVNGHTVQFRPNLYSRVCRKVRDYHSFEWDMGNDTDFAPRFPEARNRVNWHDVYGSWKQAGFETDVCVMFNNTPPDLWKNISRDAQAYGLAFAKAFGPSSEKSLVTSLEIGNEPGHYSDEKYRTLFRSMAAGVREGDPKLKILTCNMTVGKSGKYDKSVVCVEGLESLYDVLTIHTYAMAEGWPTWRRSFPEDPEIEFLKSVEKLIAWRNANAKGKEVWITEFGWDASTKPTPTTGDSSKWDGNLSDEKQAQYLVRAFLLFAAMDVHRAYLYFFNDSDVPSFHASSGITRNFEPKAAFHAVGHLYGSLADYRFNRMVLKKEGGVYACEFVHSTEPTRKIVVAWSPTASGRTAEINLPLGSSARVVRTEKMPLKAGEPSAIPHKTKSGAVQFEVDESPAYFLIKE